MSKERSLMKEVKRVLREGGTRKDLERLLRYEVYEEVLEENEYTIEDLWADVYEDSYAK